MNESIKKPEWPFKINYEGRYVRKISFIFTLFLLFFPIIPYFFLFREGYSNAARIGWGIYQVIFYPLVIGIWFIMALVGFCFIYSYC